MMKTTVALAAFAIALFVATPASSAVLNVDFGQPGDAIHAGSDGAMSAGGTVWNGVFLSEAADLMDESGAATGVGVTYLNPSSTAGFNNLGAFNDLQDTGVMCDGFEIRNLVAGETYTVVVYTAFLTSFYVEHDGGYNNGNCTGFTQTNVLPGTEGDDYCVRADLVAMELSPGVYGLRVGNVSGPVLGLQLVGALGSTSPPPADEPEPADCSSLFSFFDAAVEANTLLGNGPGKSGQGRCEALRNMLEEACSLADEGSMDDACSQLDAAARKCDGTAPDFVTGDAASELATRIATLKAAWSGASGS